MSLTSWIALTVFGVKVCWSLLGNPDLWIDMISEMAWWCRGPQSVDCWFTRIICSHGSVDHVGNRWNHVRDMWEGLVVPRTPKAWSLSLKCEADITACGAANTPMDQMSAILIVGECPSSSSGSWCRKQCHCVNLCNQEPIVSAMPFIYVELWCSEPFLPASSNYGNAYLVMSKTLFLGCLAFRWLEDQFLSLNNCWENLVVPGTSQCWLLNCFCLFWFKGLLVTALHSWHVIGHDLGEGLLVLWTPKCWLLICFRFVFSVNARFLISTLHLWLVIWHDYESDLVVRWTLRIMHVLTDHAARIMARGATN